MPRNPANDITALGQLRTKLTGAAGPADAFRSNGVVSPDGILQLAGNQANDKTRVYGDGRKWTPIQPSAPATLVAGQYYIETYGGLDWLVYVDSAGVAQRIRPAPQPNTVPVPVGPAVVLASFTVDDYRYALFEYTAQNKITGASVSGHYGVGNNGTTSADATIVQDNDVVTVTIGVVNLTFSVALSGAGVAQVMTWRGTAAAANWQVTFTQTLVA